MNATILKISGLVLLFIALEIGVLYFFFMPTPTKGATEEGAVEQAAEIDESNATDATAEVSIGNGFNCTNSRASKSVIHIDFKLVGLVNKGQAVGFQDKLKEHEARIRQAVIKVARSSNLEDLNDPNLSTIKRLIREEVNKVLRKSYVTEIVISDFSIMEQ